MPALFKPDRKVILPAGAEVVEKDGTRFARLPDRRGRSALYPVTPDGRHYLKPAAKWCADVRHADGRRTRVRFSPNKDAAAVMLADLMRRIEGEKAGVVDPAGGRHARAALADLLAAYRARTDAAGRAERTAELTVSRCGKVFAGCGWTLARHLDADAAAGWLAGRRGDRAEGGIGPQTFNHYVAALKAFGNWLFQSSRAAANPFARLSKQNAATDVRHDRRALAEDEVAALLAAARSGRPIRKMPGTDRAALYLTAGMTGLRASELASLTPESFTLAGGSPTVSVRAAYAKNRRADALPLHPALVPVLAAWLAGKPAGSPVWPGKWAAQRTAGKMLARDLAAARRAWVGAAADPADRTRREASDFLAYKDAAGRFADFHALRHTFVSNLVAANVPPKLAQELARHGSIGLTMDRYTHTTAGDRAAAVGRLAMPAAAPLDLPRAAESAAACGEGRVRPGAIENVVDHLSTNMAAANETTKPPASQGFSDDRGRLGTTSEAEREGFELRADASCCLGAVCVGKPSQRNTLRRDRSGQLMSRILRNCQPDWPTGPIPSGR